MTLPSLNPFGTVNYSTLNPFPIVYAKTTVKEPSRKIELKSPTQFLFSINDGGFWKWLMQEYFISLLFNVIGRKSFIYCLA